MVIDALSGSIASVTNVILITVIVLLLFSIIGVNLYEGRFHACQGDVYDSWSRDQRDFLTSPPDSYSQFGAIQIGYLNDTHCDNENWWAQRRKDARETSTREVTSKMLCRSLCATAPHTYIDHSNRGWSSHRRRCHARPAVSRAKMLEDSQRRKGHHTEGTYVQSWRRLSRKRCRQ